MQIREQGKQVQLIRSPYDKTLKRCVQVVFLKFKRQYIYTSANLQDYLSAEQMETLSDNERVQLSDWLKAKADKNKSDDLRFAIMAADNGLIRLADAILSDYGNAITPERAAAVWAGLDAVAKAMKKKGHAKPAKTDKKQSADSRQLDILSN